MTTQESGIVWRQLPGEQVVGQSWNGEERKAPSPFNTLATVLAATAAGSAAGTWGEELTVRVPGFGNDALVELPVEIRQQDGTWTEIPTGRPSPRQVTLTAESTDVSSGDAVAATLDELEGLWGTRVDGRAPFTGATVVSSDTGMNVEEYIAGENAARADGFTTIQDTSGFSAESDMSGLEDGVCDLVSVQEVLSYHAVEEGESVDPVMAGLAFGIVGAIAAGKFAMKTCYTRRSIQGHLAPSKGDVQAVIDGTAETATKIDVARYQQLLSTDALISEQLRENVRGVRRYRALIAAASLLVTGFAVGTVGTAFSKGSSLAIGEAPDLEGYFGGTPITPPESCDPEDRVVVHFFPNTTLERNGMPQPVRVDAEQVPTHQYPGSEVRISK